MTLQQLDTTMPADELPLWCAYEQRHGLPGTRVEASIAIGAAAVANTMGAKVKASDLIPRLDSPRERGRVLREQLREWALKHNAKLAARSAT